jgi:aspartyl/asparaginyl beta-hydroxylase (cupin superfamily)
VEWAINKGKKTDYSTSFDGRPALEKEPELTDRWPVDIWQSAFFLRLGPGGNIHKHVDEAHPWNTYHIVLLNNDQCINRVWQGARQHDFCLQPGGIYRIDRSIPHESFNNGDSERIHLLMEVRDAQNKYISGPQ